MLIYEEGYCTMCRYGVIELLAQIGPLPASLTKECQYDAYNDTRELTAEQRQVTNGAAYS